MNATNVAFIFINITQHVLKLYRCEEILVNIYVDIYMRLSKKFYKFSCSVQSNSFKKFIGLFEIKPF
jgi:hypothetical protein